MHTFESVWEDEETNRQVALKVAYSQQGEAVAIHDITPTQVTFLGNESRTIGVYTQTGKDLLVKQFRAAGRFEALEHEITQSVCRVSA